MLLESLAITGLAEGAHTGAAMNNSPLMQIDGPCRIPYSEKQSLNLLVLYDDRSSATRAKATLEGLNNRLCCEFEFTYDFWRFDVLGLIEVQEIARHAAESADLVIIATSQDPHISSVARRFLRERIFNRNNPKPLLQILGTFPAEIHESDMPPYFHSVAEPTPALPRAA